MSPAVAEERRTEAENGRSGESSAGGGSDLLPPEFFELLSEGGVGMVDPSGAVISGGYYYHHHQHHQVTNVHPASPSASEEELPCVPDSPSCSSSASQSPSQNCSSPSSPVSSPSVYPSSRLGKRKRTTSERANGALPSFTSSTQRTSSSYSSAKKSRKEREQENERKVQELTEQNERLKAEIERLGEEVQRTRRALIERLVNTRKWGEKKWKTGRKTGIKDDRSCRIGISSGGERCNMVVMKCLLDRWKPKIYFISKMIFGKAWELKMARSRKVMKVKTRKGTERRGCNSIAADKKTQHV